MRLKNIGLARDQEVLLRDVDDPLVRVGRQVDLLMAREVLERALDIRLLEKAEGELDANDAAPLLVTIEHSDLIATHRGRKASCDA